ncbi:MAG: HAD family hydrolase [Spirochaetia bacterium]|nr:HAD family hydrolase [Spirochaetia bacterium]MBQ6673394.1 HAD family hydrolase [Spirochaetia bacterium]
MGYRGILFDLDGTLLDTLADIGFYINRTLLRYGYPLFPVDKVNTIVGWGLKKALYKALPAGVGDDDPYLSRLTAELIADYNSNPVIKTAPYPGIIQLLDNLKSRGIVLGIFSNKSHPVTLQVVDKTMGLKRFAAVLGSDAGFPRKPAPEGANEVIRRMGLPKSDILYIGDTIMDHQTALGAGLDDMTVTWGFRTREELAGQGITRFIESPEEILQYF